MDRETMIFAKRLIQLGISPEDFIKQLAQNGQEWISYDQIYKALDTVEEQINAAHQEFLKRVREISE